MVLQICRSLRACKEYLFLFAQVQSFCTEDLRGFENLGGLICEKLWTSTYLKYLSNPM